MKLEDIGFYTLSDARARAVSWDSPLTRCELIVTDACNFRCPYCRGIRSDCRGSLSKEDACAILDVWAEGSIRNVRFSGGEPTLWPHLLEIVKYTKRIPTVEHIALSTNGSADKAFYVELCKAGVNDFSISLDACCASTTDKMAGVGGTFEHLCEVIHELSRQTYVTVGIVLTPDNEPEVAKTITLAHSLGVADIRVIPSAQWNEAVGFIEIKGHPILSYRAERATQGLHVRGLGARDTHRCHLVKDDMVVVGNKHFPCVIFMREQGDAIGDVRGKSIKEIRAERQVWFEKHDTHVHPICSKNCLDVCIEHNNTVEGIIEPSN